MNLRKRIFLVLVSLLVVLGIAACTSAADTVKIAFGSDDYTVKEGQTISLDINITTGSNYDAKQVQKELVYSSSDETVAKFVNGQLIGVGIGETEIKVEWSQKAIVFDKAYVTVLSSALPEIVFEDYSPNMLKGATQTIGYKFNPVYTDAQVRWESANPEVAVVDENGQVTAVAVGEATIIAYATDGVDEKAFIAKISVSESDFAIEYVLNGGVNSEANPAGYNTLNTPLELQAPTKLGYDFLGWFADEALTEEAGKIAEGSTGDVKVYAKWEIVNYNINYDLDGGANAEGNPATYTVDDEIVLAEPTKENHSFLGWVDAEGNAVTKIAKGSVGDVQVKATWKLDVFNINYDLNGGSFVTGYPYASHAELVADFVVDFNKHSGKTVAADGSDFFARSYMGNGSSAGYNFLVSSEYGAKWSWLLQLINDGRIARGAAALASTDGQAEARGEVHTFLNLTGTANTAGYGTDRTGLTFDAYASKYLPSDPSVPAVVYQYAVGVETLLPLAQKADHEFIGWSVAKEETITTSANSNFWGNYADHIFLFKAANDAKAKFSFRAYIARQEDGSYVVTKIQQSGEVSAVEGDYTLCISDSYGKYAETKAFRESIKVGDIVSFDGDPSTGNTTISLVQIYDKIAADQIGDLNFKALFAELRDDYELSYELDGGKLSDGAPKQYLCSTGLKLEMTASKLGYKFLGWSLSKGGEIIEEIPAGTRDPQTLYANYEAETYKIEYDTNGGTFSVDSVAYIYDNYEALVADFIADYSAKYGLTGVTAANFNSKSANFGLVAFWKDAELAAKWSWLQEFILSYNENYSGLSYMKNASSAANYNKYWRANLAAFLQQGKVTSPLSMDFTGLDTEAWWAENVPTKVVTVAANPKYEYTVEELPFVLEVPMRDGVEFVGWCFNNKYRDEFLSLPAGTVGDIKLYAKWSDTEEVYETFAINYELDFGRFEGEYVNSYVETIGVSSLPTPVKVGYTFLGWTLAADSSEYVTSIGTEVVGDVTLYAQWAEKESSMPKVIKVGAEEEYKTLAEAIAAASKGDTIVLAAGEYAGATIDKSLTIKGPNAGVNPNTATRGDEAILSGVLKISADNVTIDGIALTGAGKLKADTTQNISNLTFVNIYVYDSTVNVGNVSTVAPFELNVDGSNFVSDVLIANSKITTSNIKDDRPMVIYATNIKNLTMDNNVFVGRRVNYNDAVKLGNGASVGVTGNLIITNNYFENYAQYLIWLQKYGAVNVLVENNTFLNNGQTAGSHCAIRFQAYTGAATDEVNCEMYYNTVDNSYLLLKVDAAPESAKFVCNYNTVQNSKDTLIVKNATKATVTCDSNYWAFESVTDAMFNGATHTNDLTNAESIPSKEEAWLEGKLIVGADAAYKTIAEALAAAKEGDEIYLTAGTYDEAVTITVANLTIYGPNHGVAGTAERAAEAVLAQPLTVEAAGFTVDGVQFGAGCNVVVKANDATITNVHSVSTKFAKAGGTNRTAVVTTSGKVSNFELSNSFFNTGTATYLKGVFANDEAVTNALFKNNFFTHEGTDNSTLADCIAMYNSAGVIEFIGNTFEWVTDDWCIMLGSTGCAADVINVIDNNFIGKTVDGTELYTCGIMLRCAPAGSKVNVIHNYFGTLSGTIISGRNSKAGAEYNIKYNVFENMTYRQDSSNIGSAAFNYEGNYYGKPVHSSATYCTDYGKVTDKATCDELYAAWKVVQEIGTPEVYSSLSYELNGGTIEAGYDVKYLEGQKVALYAAAKEGYKFLGWSLDAEGTKVYKEIQKDWTGDIKLYAQYAEIFDIEYDLDGGAAEGLVTSAVDGTKVDLPAAEKYGNIFLGWTLEKGSEDYIKSIVVTADTKLYANWLEATFFYVDYELNGGSILYASRDALIADWLVDYNLVLGKNYASTADIATGNFADIDYHTFLDAKVELNNGQTPREKWLWLAEYLYELSVRDVASNNCNVLGLRALINQTTYSGDAIYGISYAFRAFLLGRTIRPGSSYTSVDHSVYENANGFWAKLSAAEPKHYGYYEETVLPAANLENYKFAGWYKDAEFTGEPVTKVSHADDGLKLYAKFVEATPVTSVTIDNKFAEMKRFETYQLTWTVNPSDASIQQVAFASSNPEVATIDDKGLITAVADGKTTITITSKSASGAKDSFELVVYSPDHFEIAYETESYVAIDGTVNLLAEYIKRDGSKEALTWTAQTPEIATVDANGKVTGINAGVATIRVAVASNAEVYQDFIVTVLEAEISEAVQHAIDAHESNVFTRYDLGIGAGSAPAYYADIFGSISKILYNQPLVIDEQYKAAGDATGNYYVNEGIEFVTVHYTGNMAPGSTAKANANYFVQATSGVSIHYVTGNDGVYSCLSHDKGAWHAGDSGAYNTVGAFKWMATGVKYDDCDLLEVEFTASDDFFYEINGKKTTIPLPKTYNHKERNTDHIYNADGTISAQPDYNNWGQTFANRTPESFFNDQDFPITVKDGEYYMGTTWWSYGQVYEGRICGSGGNRNSIGIESAVNPESDLWLTWQMTAQLVAKLCVDYNLGLERIKGHHFFDGKDCPQPLLENDLEIWWEFIELVRYEKALLTTLKDAAFKLTVDEDCASFVGENGRIESQPEFAKVIEYTVEVTVGDKVETITLASSVNGIYSK